MSEEDGMSDEDAKAWSQIANDLARDHEWYSRVRKASAGLAGTEEVLGREARKCQRVALVAAALLLLSVVVSRGNPGGVLGVLSSFPVKVILFFIAGIYLAMASGWKKLAAGVEEAKAREARGELEAGDD